MALKRYHLVIFLNLISLKSVCFNSLLKRSGQNIIMCSWLLLKYIINISNQPLGIVTINFPPFFNILYVSLNVNDGFSKCSRISPATTVSNVLSSKGNFLFRSDSKTSYSGLFGVFRSMPIISFELK